MLLPGGVCFLGNVFSLYRQHGVLTHHVQMSVLVHLIHSLNVWLISLASITGMAWIWFGRCWWWQKGLTLSKCPPLTQVLVLKQKRDLLLLMAVSVDLGCVVCVCVSCNEKHTFLCYLLFHHHIFISKCVSKYHICIFRPVTYAKVSWFLGLSNQIKLEGLPDSWVVATVTWLRGRVKGFS